MAITIAALEERVNNNIKFFWVVVAFGFAWLGGITFLLIQTKATVDRLPLQISESLVAKAKREALNGRQAQALNAIQAATAMVATAQDQNLRAEPKFFEQQIKVLSSIPENQELLPQLSGFRFALASYRSHINPLPKLPQETGAFQSPSDISPGKIYDLGGPLFMRKNVSLVGPNPSLVAIDGTRVPKDQFLLVAPSRSMEDNNITVRGVSLIGGNLMLDGVNWDNVTFIRMHISYESGSMKLKNVRFVDCTFDLPSNQDGSKIADYAALNATGEFRIG